MPTMSTGGEGRDLDRHPHEADIVGGKRQVHREHQELIHRVVETQISGRQPSGLEFMADIARAEHAGGEGDEGGECDDMIVEIIDEQVVSRGWPLGEEQRQRCEKGSRGSRAR